MKVKSTLPARNAQTSRLWRITDAICQGPVLQLVQVCAILDLNTPIIWWTFVKEAVIRWMPVKTLNVAKEAE